MTRSAETKNRQGLAGLINITDNILLRVAWTNKQYNKHPQKGFSLGLAGLINITDNILLRAGRTN